MSFRKDEHRMMFVLSKVKIQLLVVLFKVHWGKLNAILSKITAKDGFS